MRIKLNQLQEIVKEAFDEDRSLEALRSEVKRVLGTSVITTGKITEVISSANERIDYVEHAGKGPVDGFNPKTLIPFMESKNADLRRLVAKTLPLSFAKKLAFDRNPHVRYAVAQRLTPSQIKQVMKRFPMDENLNVIHKQRLVEFGEVKFPSEPFDLYGDKRMSDAFPEDEETTLSDAFYLQTAKTMMQDYGRTIDEGWEEAAVRRYVASERAVSGTIVDGKKLLEKIRELREEHEDILLKKYELKESKFSLRESMDGYFINTPDEVRALVESKTSDSSFMKAFESLLQIKESRIPAAIRMYCLGEGNARPSTAPVVGQLPHDEGFRSIDERALDTYCESWNNRQRLSGEPLRLDWSMHPGRVGKVSFHVSLKLLRNKRPIRSIV